MNEAFQLKLAWIFLNQDHRLWVKLLRSKYVHPHYIFPTRLKSNCSRIWRNIYMSILVLKPDLTFKVTMNSSINIWNVPWIIIGNESTVPMGLVDRQVGNILFNDLMDSKGN
uniref:Uncharacterized protein n=1 Tax=Nelumbo nucifera TaxID=4432 RepID=A0A822Z275_NELNU|nr:TPA_asm: hypothetical protein HUJ06_007736 [Nelumbo nucifera]DAD37096.1 TPA_asm: hypothetical protein HUJ06_007737 [Nelumbo nucifera]